MSVRGFVTRKFHDVMCRPDRVREVADGCVGCGGDAADVYVTVGCGWCRAAGESFCWKCLDAEEFPWWNGVTLADFTVLPGRERT